MEPKDLSSSELLKFKEHMLAVYSNAIDFDEKGKASITLSMINEELVNRGLMRRIQ